MFKRNAIIFVDGSNFYHNSKSIIKESKRINFNCLAQFICDKFNLKLKQVRYYNAIPDISDNKEIYYNHLGFLDKLRKENIIVKIRKLKYIKKLKIKIEKGVDVLIASDMIRKSLVEKECDVCVLISGDADFIPSIQIIKNAGYEAIICSPKDGFSNELRQGNFRYLILKEGDLDKCLN
ncbi:MAG: NYN domain-containing protein [Nanoarchaeota archaeon]|nr:NYN domain-containing protein [Nanoarchaeota archaeon]